VGLAGTSKPTGETSSEAEPGTPLMHGMPRWCWSCMPLLPPQHPISHLLPSIAGPEQQRVPGGAVTGGPSIPRPDSPRSRLSQHPESHPRVPLTVPFTRIPPAWALLLASHLENSLQQGHVLHCASPGEAHILSFLLIPSFFWH